MTLEETKTSVGRLLWNAKVFGEFMFTAKQLDGLIELVYLCGEKHGLAEAGAIFNPKPAERHMHVKDDDAGDSCKTCGRDLRDEIHFRVGEPALA